MKSLFMCMSVFVALAIPLPWPAAIAAEKPCDTQDSKEACSVQDYKEKMCKSFDYMTKTGFKEAARGEASPPVEKLAEYFIASWEKNLSRSGNIPILSDPEKKHVHYLMKGIYSGKWKSPADVYKNCMSEGNAFPQYLRSELAEMKKHFSSSKP